MENCVDMKVPSVVDAEFGPSWGECKLFDRKHEC